MTQIKVRKVNTETYSQSWWKKVKKEKEKKIGKIAVLWVSILMIQKKSKEKVAHSATMLN